MKFRPLDTTTWQCSHFDYSYIASYDFSKDILHQPVHFLPLCEIGSLVQDLNDLILVRPSRYPNAGADNVLHYFEVFHACRDSQSEAELHCN